MKSKRRFNNNQIDKTIITYHAPYSVEAGFFKAFSTNLIFPSSGSPHRTILITSALPNDGKTFVSTNLAISIAQSVSNYALLIDGDIRRPDLHTRLGFGNVTGLSEFLVNGDDVANVFLKPPIEKLTLLPAGKPPANPTELMASKKMEGLLEEVKARYDDRFIIIDTPPPIMATETKAIMKYVDKVILVVKANKTPRAAVADTIKHIGKEKILGIVFNQPNRIKTKYFGYSKFFH